MKTMFFDWGGVVADDSVVPDITITPEPQPGMREDLLDLFEIPELEKYYTSEELADHPGRRAP